MEFFKDSKKISFCPFITVCIIPEKEFYIVENIKDDLWWTNYEFTLFRQSCLQEIREFICRHKNMTVKQASKLLYQPGSITITYDPANFE